MADPRFFDRGGPFTLEALSALSGARLLHPQGGARLFRDVSPLETAGPEDVSFLENRKYLQTFVRSRAGAVFVDEQVAGRAPPGMALLVSDEPTRLMPSLRRPSTPRGRLSLTAHRRPSSILRQPCLKIAMSDQTPLSSTVRGWGGAAGSGRTR